MSEEVDNKEVNNNYTSDGINNEISTPQKQNDSVITQTIENQIIESPSELICYDDEQAESEKEKKDIIEKNKKKNSKIVKHVEFETPTKNLQTNISDNDKEEKIFQELDNSDIKEEKSNAKNFIRSLTKKSSLILQIDEISAQKIIQRNTVLNTAPKDTSLVKEEIKVEVESVKKIENKKLEVNEEIKNVKIDNNNSTNTNNSSKIIKKDKKENDNSYMSENQDESKIQKKEKSTTASTYEIDTKVPTSILKKDKDSKTNYDSLNKSKNIDYQRYMFKVILLGNIAVGKTCLLSYFVDSVFRHEYTCTVGVDFKIKTVTLPKNKKVDLQIWDTSGEERFKTITRQYYRDAAGIVLVYDVTNEKSFADVVHWIEDIRLCAKSNVSIVLVGNKTDLENQRVVSYRTAQQYARHNDIEYYETSARTGQSVGKLFSDLAQIMVNVYDYEETTRRMDEQKSSFLNNNDHQKRDVKLDLGVKSKKKNCC